MFGGDIREWDIIILDRFWLNSVWCNARVFDIKCLQKLS